MIRSIQLCAARPTQNRLTGPAPSVVRSTVASWSITDLPIAGHLHIALKENSRIRLDSFLIGRQGVFGELRAAAAMRANQEGPFPLP